MMRTQDAEVHIVWGAGNRGKSTLIFYMVNYMLLNGARIICNMNGNTIGRYPCVGEYCILLKYNGKVFLIMSKGDNVEELERQLENFEHFDIHIDIILGASRTREATPKWWDSLPKRELQWFNNNKDIAIESERHKDCLLQFEALKKQLKIV